LGKDQGTQVRIVPWREQAHDVTCRPKKNRSRSKGALGEMAKGTEDGIKRHARSNKLLAGSHRGIEAPSGNQVFLV
jgi:hypothetical protein